MGFGDRISPPIDFGRAKDDILYCPEVSGPSMIEKRAFYEDNFRIVTCVGLRDSNLNLRLFLKK